MSTDKSETPIADRLCGMANLHPRDARFAKVILEVAELERELNSAQSEIAAQPNAVQAAGASQNVFEAIAYPKNREFEPPAHAAPSYDKSDTPRTDSFQALIRSGTGWAEFARQLERELNAARSAPTATERAVLAAKQWNNGVDINEIDINAMAADVLRRSDRGGVK